MTDFDGVTEADLLPVRIQLATLRLGYADLDALLQEVEDTVAHRRILRAFWAARAKAVADAAARCAEVLWPRQGAAASAEFVAAAERLVAFENTALRQHGWRPPSGGGGIDPVMLGRARACGRGRENRHELLFRRRVVPNPPTQIVDY